MTSIEEFRSALEAVPDVLLHEDDARVRDEAITSLDAMLAVDIVPTAIAVVGSSGVGKSAIVNACVGAAVCDVGVIRPTTKTVAMVGSSGPVSLSVESEYLHAALAPAGFVFIDTPAWEHDRRAVSAVNIAANLVVIVVTPSRYADASVAELVASIPSRQPAAVVLNRVVPGHHDVDELRDDVRAVFGADVVIATEHGDLVGVAETLMEGLEIDTLGYQRGAVLRSAAGSGGRHVAGAVTAAAPLLGSLAGTIDAVRPTVTVAGTVLDTWEATRNDLVASIALDVAAVDQSIIDADRSGLAARVFPRVPKWSRKALASRLDSWMSETVEVATGHARIRWRRTSAIAMIERFAWKRAINRDIVAPPRFDRLMRAGGDEIWTTARAQLDEVMRSEVADRRSSWSGLVAELGSYAPGDLLTAAEGFSPIRAAPDGGPVTEAR